MRYAEQIKFSWHYNWGLFCGCWDTITLGRLKWYLALVLVALFYLAIVVELLTAKSVAQFFTLPRIIPPPDVPADILSARDFLRYGNPPMLLALNYFWVTGSDFFLLMRIVVILTAVGFAGAWLRGEGGIDKAVNGSQCGLEIIREEFSTRVKIGMVICIIGVVLIWHFFIFNLFSPHLPVG